MVLCIRSMLLILFWCYDWVYKSYKNQCGEKTPGSAGLGYSCFSCHLDLVFSVVYSILSPMVCPMVNDMKLGQCVLPERKDMCACLQVVNMYPQSTYCYFIGSQSFQIKVSQQVKHKRTVRDRSL